VVDVPADVDTIVPLTAEKALKLIGRPNFDMQEVSYPTQWLEEQHVAFFNRLMQIQVHTGQGFKDFGSDSTKNAIKALTYMSNKRGLTQLTSAIAELATFSVAKLGFQQRATMLASQSRNTPQLTQAHVIYSITGLIRSRKNFKSTPCGTTTFIVGCAKLLSSFTCIAKQIRRKNPKLLALVNTL
jgi:hypothetical protein